MSDVIFPCSVRVLKAASAKSLNADSAEFVQLTVETKVERDTHTYPPPSSFPSFASSLSDPSASLLLLSPSLLPLVFTIYYSLSPNNLMLRFGFYLLFSLEPEFMFLYTFFLHDTSFLFRCIVSKMVIGFVS